MTQAYTGTFADRYGSIWCINLYTDEDNLSVRPLSFPASSPLTIEWGEAAKEETIVSSTATLRIISYGDRTFQHLYCIRPGAVKMEVRRDGLLFWSGTLDPELYEEPYAAAADYEVSLSFSDFGILDRLYYEGAGTIDGASLIANIVERSGITTLGIETLMSTTTVPASTSEGLAQVAVRSDNFFDEDGEAASLRDVVDGLLRPLALRIEQRGGKVWIYDLHSAYHHLPTEKVEWASDDQMLSTDSVYNSVKITFSPYGTAELLNGEIEYPGEISEEKVNRDDGTDPGYDSYYPDYNPNWDYNNISFTIFTTRVAEAEGKETGITLYHGRYFHILPMLGGSESSGVAWTYYTGGHGSLASGYPVRRINDPAFSGELPLMRTRRVYLPPLASDSDRARYRLRLSMQMLLDTRYNPFTTASEHNESGNYERMKTLADYVMIPVDVILYDEKGNATHHYSNSETARSTTYDPRQYCEATGKWKSGAPSYGEAWLEYYDPADMKDSSGVQEWKGNRHCIGLCKEKKLHKSMAQMDDGEYIPYPPAGGFIEIIVYAGMKIFDFYESDFDNPKKAIDRGLYERIRWMLYQAPKLEVVRKNIVRSSAGAEDVETAGKLNLYAKEELSISTICGTLEDPSPTARGQLLHAETGCPLTTINRAGREGTAETLLLGTLYSQFADRKVRLDGTAFPTIFTTDLCLMSDGGWGEKRFIVVGEHYDVAAGEREVSMIEVRPDEYDPITI